MDKKEITQWRPVENHKGVFDDYTVMGRKFENASFEIGWDITAWRKSIDPIHGYWVARGNFYSATFHMGYKGTPLNVIDIFQPPITESIEPAERKAVLKAIDEWVQVTPEPSQRI